MKHHSDTFKERWEKLTLAQQLGNIGSEYERALSWKKRGDESKFQNAFERFLELLDLTIANPHVTMPQKKELLRAREIACQELTETNATDNYLQKYFYQFALLANKDK